MFYLIKEQLIKKSVPELFEFFSIPENLNLLTPEFLNFKFDESNPKNMELGTVFKYKIKLGFIPFRWKTVIVNLNHNHSFTDAQFKGPYKHWIHTHLFIEDGKNTIMKDIVFYDLYGGFLKHLINKFFVRKKVEMIFEYRFNKIEEIFNKEKN